MSPGLSQPGGLCGSRRRPDGTYPGPRGGCEHGVGLGAVSELCSCTPREPEGSQPGRFVPDPVMAPALGHTSDTSQPAPLCSRLPCACRADQLPLCSSPAPWSDSHPQCPTALCLLPLLLSTPLAFGGSFNASVSAEEAKGHSSKPAACAALQAEVLLLSSKVRERQKSLTCPVPLSTA